MTYKETLFFIGKCLTVNYNLTTKISIEKELKTATIDWDSVVKLSTSHYVFPALYCNFKKADFLHYLPQDLVDYMEYITHLNRERNKEIIEQTKEINELLSASNITPIFLKGTGNLLEGLYDDIAERMLGDIDILIKKEDCNRAFEILQKNNYTKVLPVLFEDHRHLPRIINPNKIAAMEIHREMLLIEKSKYFNYESIKDSLKHDINNNCYVLSDENKIKLTIYSKLINDKEYILKRITLRAAYDFFLVASKSSNTLYLHDENLGKELNAGVEVYNFILPNSKNVSFDSNKQSKLHLKRCLKAADRSFYSVKYYQFILLLLKLEFNTKFIFKSFFNKSYMKFILSRLFRHEK
ncbi:MAG: nucleotidyltransferase family protein [Polaribacter sp.]|uniref:nucleotidyltransferase family protein n=1 Tax=Polaribacter sp. TaxID=1920175 RepID=UPI003BAE5392